MGFLRVFWFGLSIARISFYVERDMLVSMFCDLVAKFQLGPSKLSRGTKIPIAFLLSSARFHDDDILCPAYLHSFSQKRRTFLVCAVKIPHPAHIPWGETGRTRVFALQISRCSDSRALLRAGADKSANLVVQLNLLKIVFHQVIQRGKQLAIIHGFSDIHFSFSFLALKPDATRQRKTRSVVSRAFLCLAFYMINSCSISVPLFRYILILFLSSTLTVFTSCRITWSSHSASSGEVS